MEFQAVIMAGGRGSQMNDLTSSIPKPLLPVGHKPLIWYSVNMLENAGFKEVIIVTLNSIVTQVRQAVSSCTRIVAEIVGISEDNEWGTTDSLRHIHDKIKADLLILSCDILCDLPLHKLADVYRLHDSSVTMLLAPARLDIENVPGTKTKKKNQRQREIFGLDEKAGVRRKVIFLENEADIEEDVLSFRRSLFKTQSHIHVHTNLTDVHAYIIKKWILDYILYNTTRSSFRGDLLPYLVQKQWKKPKNDSNQTEAPSSLLDQTNSGDEHINYGSKDIFTYLGKSVNVESADLSLKTTLQNRKSLSKFSTLSCYSYIYDNGFCMRVNTIPVFVEANRMISKKLASLSPNLSDIPLIHPTVKIQEKTQIGSDSMVGEETVIGEKVSVKRCVIGKHCVIGNYVKLSNCILLDRVSVENGSIIQGSVLSDNVKIGEKSTIKDSLIGSRKTIQPMSTVTNESLVESAAMMEFD